MTLSTSDPELHKSFTRTGRVYLLITLFCLLFAAIYECFSHEVYSGFMIFAFAFPLVGGALPHFILSKINGTCLPAAMSTKLYHFGIATLTVGSIMQGVLEIYGTTNDLLLVYWIVGGLLVGLALLRTLLKR